MARNLNELTAILNTMIDFENGNLDIGARTDLLSALRQDPEKSKMVDEFMIRRLESKTRGLKLAEANLEKFKEVLDKMSAEPWFPGTFLSLVTMPAGRSALVRQGANERLVGLGDDIDPDTLRSGDQVFLSANLNVLMALAPCELCMSGDLCTFERWIDGERVLIKSRDEQMVLSARPALAQANLKPGSMLRFNRETMLALEVVEKSNDSQFFLEETPRETFKDIGGLGIQVERIQECLSLHLSHQDLVSRYQLAPNSSVLLHGPAGTGKTLIARALAGWLGETAPDGRSFFMNIKPGQLHSMWFGQAEANYREAFRIARETAEANPGTRVVIFFDEIDAIGTARGASQLRINDSVLTAFLAELDGLSSRGNILVIGATNRRDMLDPALLRPGRLGDLVLEVPRPNREAARDIFGKHLRTDIPYAQNGHGDDHLATRSEIIDTAVSIIFAQNAGSELATITFRDGKQKVVCAADLISGAVIANISRTAVERACVREKNTDIGNVGLEWSDLEAAIEQQFASTASVLTPSNCRSHLDGLPDDLDVVSIKPVVRKVARSHRFLTIT